MSPEEAKLFGLIDTVLVHPPKTYDPESHDKVRVAGSM
jgi:hypothetical protein